MVRPPEEVDKRRKLVRLVQVALAATLGFLLMNVIIASFLSTSPSTKLAAQWIGFLLGGLGTSAVVIQWTPQIITTWRLQAVGSLSLVMLLIQLPGILMVVYFHAIVNKGHWSTVLPFIATALQFAVLIILCSFFMARDWWRIRAAAKLAQAHPEYAFENLDNTIQTKRTVISTSPDEAEAESMMNLELDEEEEVDLEDHHSSTHFNDDMKEVNNLIEKMKDSTSSQQQQQLRHGRDDSEVVKLEF